jgi:pimeloyl-ACP methyl ester carboxylesterase
MLACGFASASCPKLADQGRPLAEALELANNNAPQEPGLEHSTPNRDQHKQATVILVHGLWTPAAVFALHSHWLKRHAYRTRRFGYPSVRATLTQNAQALKTFVAATTASEIHLVGHSMGGLIILDLLAQAPDPRLRRAVFLGTPSLDSHCARRLARMAGMPTLLGRSIMEWLSRPTATSVLPQSSIPIGVLAGTRSVGLGRIVPSLPQPNDGVVSVAETRLPGAADFITLPVAHSEMLASRACAAQIVSFLETGRFRHD